MNFSYIFIILFVIADLNLNSYGQSYYPAPEKDAIGTCMYYGGIHYQPPSDLNEPNHATAKPVGTTIKLLRRQVTALGFVKSGWNGNGYFWI